MRKIKVFLGGYVNYPNAQNVNCDNIAKYLNKKIFEVHTMYISTMPIEKKVYHNQDIHLHKVIPHRYIWYWTRWWIMRLGKYDIYYLPKAELVDQNFMKKYKGKFGIFITSVEGVLTAHTKNMEMLKKYHMNYADNFFAISHCIAKSIKQYWGVSVQVLPLGTVERLSHFESKKFMKTIIWVGNIKKNKRPQYLVECAKQFPEISFIMVGDGNMQDEIEQTCQKQNIKNIVFTGRIPNSDVYMYMEQSDLLLMTSEFEGLPKVIQEAAQCGVPSIYINENYSVDFIENNINGFAVSNLDTMIEKIQYLIDNPKKYRQMSINVFNRSRYYTWNNLIKKYESYFMDQLKKESDRSKDGET